MYLPPDLYIPLLVLTFCSVAAEVPYNVTVKALNLAGCGEEQQIYCFTQEGGITVDLEIFTFRMTKFHVDKFS